VSSEEKLNDFDKKLRRLDTMVALLETKLNSLPPEITSTYPPLAHQSINDVNPFFVSKQEVPVNNPPVSNQAQPPINNNVAQPPENVPVNQVESIPEEENKAVDDSPEAQLRVFLEENENLDKFHKMLKYGIPTMAIEQKAKLEGIEGDLIAVRIHNNLETL
jgi:hypothetical protein